MNEKNTKTLAKYLLTKGVDSALKIQKMLFFFRVEEKISNFPSQENSYFDEKDNFEAWIYGPVNVESFKYMRNVFLSESEKEEFLLDEKNESEEKIIQELDKLYLQYFEKYNQYSARQLVEKSHKNLAWIEARGDLGPDDICHAKLNENDKIFVEFEF